MRLRFDSSVAPVATSLAAVQLSCEAVRIAGGRRRLELADVTTTELDSLGSSIPLPTLVSFLVDAAVALHPAAERLMRTDVHYVRIGEDRPEIGPGHRVFCGETVRFVRTCLASKFAQGNALLGKSPITCDVASSRHRQLNEKRSPGRCHHARIRDGVLRASDRTVVPYVTDAPFGYVVFDAALGPGLDVIVVWLERSRGLGYARFGEWSYDGSFDALESGRRAGERARALFQ